MSDFMYVGQIQSLYYNVQPHKHEHWEICYYTEGKGINRVGDREIPFEDGCIVCQPPGVEHGEESKDGFKNMFFGVRSLNDCGMDIPVFYDNYNRDYKQLLTQMLSCYHLGSYNCENILNAIVTVLSEYMISWNAARRKSRYVEECEKIIIDNISNCDFSLKDIIEKIPMSGTYFMKLFKKETGSTPSDYLADKRVGYAKRLLSGKDAQVWRIKDIAYMCGYNDPYYFSRVFKKKTGLSPQNKRHDAVKSDSARLQLIKSEG